MAALADATAVVKVAALQHFTGASCGSPSILSLSLGNGSKAANLLKPAQDSLSSVRQLMEG